MAYSRSKNYATCASLSLCCAKEDGHRAFPRVKYLAITDHLSHHLQGQLWQKETLNADIFIKRNKIANHMFMTIFLTSLENIRLVSEVDKNTQACFKSQHGTNFGVSTEITYPVSHLTTRFSLYSFYFLSLITSRVFFFAMTSQFISL